MSGLGPVQQRLSDAAGLGRWPDKNSLDVFPVQTDESLYRAVLPDIELRLGKQRPNRLQLSLPVPPGDKTVLLLL